MSTYAGIEIVIASENRSALKKLLKYLCDEYFWHSSFKEYCNRIRKVGDAYIIQIREQIYDKVASSIVYRFKGVSYYYSLDILDEYGCDVEITTESQDKGISEHVFRSKKENIDEKKPLVSILFDPSTIVNDYCHTKPCFFELSKTSARIFNAKPELYEKWYGINKFTLESPDCFYIGKGNANTKKYIDLEDYCSLLYPKKSDPKKKVISKRGKTILSYDDENNEVIDEYDKNGLLIHHKDSKEESRWSGEGELIYKKTPLLEIFYEYDGNGKLLKEYYTEGYEIKYEYNKHGQLIEEKDNEGHRAVYSYNNGVSVQKTCFNRMGQIVNKTSSDGNDLWCEYDKYGHPICEIRNFLNHRNRIHYYRYDFNGNIIMEWHKPEYEYVDDGNCLCLHFYDSKNRIIFSEEKNQCPELNVYDDKIGVKYEIYKSKHYNINGDVSSVCDNDGKLLFTHNKTKKENKWFDNGYTFVHRHISSKESEWLEYDANDKLVRKIVFCVSDDYVYYTEYDEKNNMIHKIDRYGNQEWYDYDGCGRLIRSRDLWGGEKKYEYDEKGKAIEYFKNECGEFVLMEKSK